MSARPLVSDDISISSLLGVIVLITVAVVLSVEPSAQEQTKESVKLLIDSGIVEVILWTAPLGIGTAFVFKEVKSGTRGKAVTELYSRVGGAIAQAGILNTTWLFLNRIFLQISYNRTFYVDFSTEELVVMGVVMIGLFIYEATNV